MHFYVPRKWLPIFSSLSSSGADNISAFSFHAKTDSCSYRIKYHVLIQPINQLSQVSFLGHGNLQELFQSIKPELQTCFATAYTQQTSHYWLAVITSSCTLTPLGMGFTARKSTLISFTHYILEAADLGHEVCSDFFDLSKAFDKVPHSNLTCKLLDLNFKPFLIQWSEITCRVGNRRSSWTEKNYVLFLSSPVFSRGSVLGPLLFLIYIDKVSRAVTSSKLHCYVSNGTERWFLANTKGHYYYHHYASVRMRGIR